MPTQNHYKEYNYVDLGFPLVLDYFHLTLKHQWCLVCVSITSFTLTLDINISVICQGKSV